MIERTPIRVAQPFRKLYQTQGFLLTHLCRPHPVQRLLSLPIRLYAIPTPPPSKSNAPESSVTSPFTRPPPPPPPPKRNLRTFIYATIFFAIGATAGKYMTLVISPPPLPPPDTPEDLAFASYISSRASKLPIVQSLTADPSFVSWPAYSIFSPEDKLRRLTTGPLGGSRGLGGYQHIFYNKDTGEIVSVLWIGGAVAGWPGVAHGGLLATVLDETLGRCAIARFKNKSGVTANLELKYLSPTMTNSFVVVRCAPALEGSTDRKGFVTGRLETLDGKVCVEAKALFISPKHMKLKSFEEPEEGVGF